MNLKTTFILLLLLGAGAGAWYWIASRQPAEAPSPTLAFLKDELTPDQLTRVEVLRGRDSRFVLEKTGGEWSLPGKWPVRTTETQQWLDQLTGLGSRFAPLPAGDVDKNYGIDGSSLTVKVKLGAKEHTLRFGEGRETTNRFTRPTYMRLDEHGEVVRLGPGVLANLDRTQDYFQQRRLFPVERVAREEDSKEKIEQVAATAIAVKAPATSFRLVKKDDAWELTAPVEDRTEPAKVKAILTGVPDLWAEKFVSHQGKSLADFGLIEPPYVLTITRPSGAQVKLLIGAVAETKTRLVTKPGPPPQFGMPQKPMVEPVTEEYRFAKLEDNDQVFWVKTDKLPEVAPALAELRDPQLARFKTDDVRQVEIKQGDRTIALARADGKWKLDGKHDAESTPVNDLLDKLSGLQAKDKEVLDKADVKEVGLDPAQATVKLTLEEGKDKKKREIVYQLGNKTKDAGKLYVRVAGWPRVNEVNADVLKLVERPELAYRSKRLLDVAASDVKRLEVKRQGETFALERDAGAWKLAEPVKAEVDSKPAGELADDVLRLEAVELIADQPKEKDLDETYGLSKATLSAKIVYQDEKKQPQTLLVGKQRPGKEDYFARLDQGPVFAVKKSVQEHLDRASLAYRPLQLWQLPASDISEVTVTRDGKEYRLKRDDKKWKIAGPFDAVAGGEAAEDLADELAKPKAERYETHEVKDPARFGLDKPHLQVKVAAGRETKVLEVGKSLEKEPKSRYGRVNGAVVVLGDKTLAALDKSALDLLDPSLLTLDTARLQRIRVEGPRPFTLEHKDDKWQVVDSPAPAFEPDAAALQESLRPWERLRAAKFAAYGDKIDWKQFGLDKPAVKLTAVEKAEKEDKTSTHVLELGKELEGGQRYARLDRQSAVAVLDTSTSEALARSYLDFVDARVLSYDLDTVTALRRAMKGADLELIKKGELWEIVKPEPRRADDPTVNDILEKTFRLRAQRVAAYPAKDLKPFGLGEPAAVVTLELAGAKGEKSQHVIRVGAVASDVKKKDSEERYALVDKSDKVIVLPAELSKQLVAGQLAFADRTLTGLVAPDEAILERGLRQATFARPEGRWQMIAPVKAEAEDTDMEDLVRSLQRLRADEVVAEKGADLAKFGLDKPFVQWRFKTGPKEVLHVMIGSAEPGEQKQPRRYAKLGGSEQVVLLDSKVSDKLLAEYRNRKPWPSLDAAQVDQLTITNGGKTFALKKRDTSWNLAESPDAMVDIAAVTDALDALAGLKAQRYITDAKANLQLFGLMPPAWKIEAQTPSGTRTLWLGRTEGESQRYYAVVPGSDAVFLTSDADGPRLTRPQSAFVQASKVGMK